MEDNSPASTLLARCDLGQAGILNFWYVAGYKHPFRIELLCGSQVETLAHSSTKISGLAKFLKLIPVGMTFFDNSRD